MSFNKTKILAIPGSLRADSSTREILDIIATLLPPTIEFVVYEGIADLPHFNDETEVATSVENLRNRIKMSDGILVCTPEYAFGVPGSLKNAIDWTVSSGEFVGKPLALITAATGGEKAHASLLLTFGALSADVQKEHTLLISFIRAKLKGRHFTDSATLSLVQQLVENFLSYLHQKKK